MKRKPGGGWKPSKPEYSVVALKKNPCELKQTLVKSLTKSELQHVNEAICVLTDMLKR